MILEMRSRSIYGMWCDDFDRTVELDLWLVMQKNFVRVTEREPCHRGE